MITKVNYEETYLTKEEIFFLFDNIVNQYVYDPYMYMTRSYVLSKWNPFYSNHIIGTGFVPKDPEIVRRYLNEEPEVELQAQIQQDILLTIEIGKIFTTSDEQIIAWHYPFFLHAPFTLEQRRFLKLLQDVFPVVKTAISNTAVTPEAYLKELTNKRVDSSFLKLVRELEV